MADIQRASQAQPSALEEQPGATPPFDFEALLRQELPSTAGGAPTQPQPALPLGQAQEFNFDALIAQSGLQQEVAPGAALGVAERAKLSFARTVKEKRGFLERLPGVTEVTEKDGDFTVIRNGKKQKVDPETFELLADVADFAREALEVGIEAPIASAGIPGGPVGLMAAGAAGAAVATNVGDFIGQSFGIERDETRSRVLETGLAAGLGGILAGAGVVVGKLIAARKAAKQVTEKLSSTDAITKNSQEFVNSINEVDKLNLEGEVLGTDGKPIKFLLTNLDSPNPKIQEAAERIKVNPEFQRIEQELGEQATENVNQIVKSIGDTQGFSNVLEQASKDKLIGQKVTSMLQRLRTQEGQTIERFKKFASAEFRTTPVPVSKTDEALADVLKELGVTRRGDELVGLDADSVADVLIIDKSPAITRFTTDLSNLVETLNNKGGLSPDDVEKFVGRIGKLNQSPLMRKTGKLRFLNGKLSTALRKDRIDIVESALEGTPNQGKFREAMAKFSNIASSTEQVGALLRGNEMASSSFVKSIFNKGKEGLSDLRVAKGLIQKEDPQLWNELSGEFITQIIDDVTDSGTKKLSINAFSKKFLSFGKEIRNEILEGAPFSDKDLRRAMNVARRFEAKKFENLTRSQQENLSRIGLQVLSPFRDANVRGFRSLFRMVFPDKKAREFLTQEGIDKLLTGVPAKTRSKLRKKIEESLILLGDMQPGARGRAAVSTGVRGGVQEE